MIKFKNALNKKNAIVIGKKIGFEYFKINLKMLVYFFFHFEKEYLPPIEDEI